MSVFLWNCLRKLVCIFIITLYRSLPTLPPCESFSMICAISPMLPILFFVKPYFNIYTFTFKTNSFIALDLEKKMKSLPQKTFRCWVETWPVFCSCSVAAVSLIDVRFCAVIPLSSLACFFSFRGRFSPNFSCCHQPPYCRYLFNTVNSIKLCD